MATTISIIGLGQVGASLGLALKPYAGKIKRLGHDKSPETAQWAYRLGAVDKIHFMLLESIQTANLVILALPADQVLTTLEQIGPDLREGAVVVDTSPLKAPLLQAASKILPAGRSFVGLIPAINPALLGETDHAPRADFFARGTLGIVAAPHTPAEAIKLVTDLAQLLESEPFFLEPAEADGLMTSVHLLPQFLSAALLNITAGRPGWNEARRLAGRPYAGVVSAGQETPESLASFGLLNPEAALWALDEVTVELQKMRLAIQNQEAETLTGLLARANQRGQAWLGERQRGDWQAVEAGKPTLPETPSFWGGLFGKRKK